MFGNTKTTGIQKFVIVAWQELVIAFVLSFAQRVSCVNVS